MINLPLATSIINCILLDHNLLNPVFQICLILNSRYSIISTSYFIRLVVTVELRFPGAHQKFGLGSWHGERTLFLSETCKNSAPMGVLAWLVCFTPINTIGMFLPHLPANGLMPSFGTIGQFLKIPPPPLWNPNNFQNPRTTLTGRNVNMPKGSTRNSDQNLSSAKWEKWNYDAK